MSHYVSTLQSSFDKAFVVYDVVQATADQLYWLDDNYVQPFYSWAVPQLRKAFVNGLDWTIAALIDVSLWLIDTTLQFMDRDAQAIALSAFAKAHEPLPDCPALPPAAVSLVLPSMALPIAPGPDLAIGDDGVPAIDSTIETSKKNALIVAPQLLAKAVRLGLNLILSGADKVQQTDNEPTPGTLLMLPPLNYKNVATIAPAKDESAKDEPAKDENDPTYSLLVPGALGTRKSRKKNAVTW